MPTKASSVSLLIIMSMFASTEAVADRYIPGNMHRIGVRSSAMGGNHMALSGEICGAFTNPATILLSENATLFSVEGFLPEGPDFDTENGQNMLRTRQDSPPLLLGISFTYADDFAFAIVDGLRYDARYTGHLLVLDNENAHITDFQEEVRLNTSGFVVAARALEYWQFGLALYYDRQKLFKRVDYTVESQYARMYRDYEAFGTATALHGGFGVLWTPRGRTSYGMALQTNVDLRNNVRLDQFNEDIIPNPDDPTNFDESSPVSDDRFPWSLTAGVHHALRPTTDLYGDVALIYWNDAVNRDSEVSVSLGGEWRKSPAWGFRGGLYTRLDPSDFTETLPVSEDDARFMEIRSPTHSTYPAQNDEVFLTAGAGFKASVFEIDASIEDSHLFADFGRTIVKLGLTAVLPTKSSKSAN